MAEIRNKIILEDEMSAALLAIQQNIKDTINIFEGISTAAEDAAESIEILGLYAGDMQSAFENISETIEETNEATQEHNEVIEIMQEAMGETTELIAEMAEAIEEKTEKVEEFNKEVKKIDRTAQNAARGVQQLTKVFGGSVAELGKIPNHARQSVQAVTQLRNAMNASVPVATKLTMALGPIALIATAIMGVVSALQVFSRETDSVVVPSADDLLSRSERLSNESERLERSLIENIRLMERMNELGASESLISRFERENQLLGSQIQALDRLSFEKETRGIEQLQHEAFRALTQTERAQTTFMERLRASLSGNLSEVVFQSTENMIDATERMLSSLEEGIHFSSFDERSLFFDNIEAMRIHANELRDSTIPSHMETVATLDEMIERFGELDEAILFTAIQRERLAAINNDYHDEETERMNARDARQNAIERAQEQMNRNILRSYRDIYSAAESLRDAHYNLSNAIEAMNTEYGVTLDQFTSIMNMSPQYLQFLFDEYGELRNVEDAVFDVTQAQINLMGVRQANALLDMVAVWDAETGALKHFIGTTDLATESVWDLVEARMAALKMHEDVSEEAYAGIRRQIDQLRNLTFSAAERAASPYGTVRTAQGNALLVSDPANQEIRGEIMRLKEDVAGYVYFGAGGSYTSTPIVVNVGGINEQVYANQLSDVERERIAQRAGEYAAPYVAEGLQRALNHDLRNGGNRNYRGAMG